MPNFLNKNDIKLSQEFEKKGYIIRNILNKQALRKIENIFVKFIRKELKIDKKIKSYYLLNNIHKFLKTRNLNSFRIKLINHINNSGEFKKLYYLISKNYLETLVGNELVMQKRINLSIQTPNDNSSLLPVHSDVWSGDSPFEIVAWLPLVDCFKSKSMYLLPPKKSEDLYLNFSEMAGKSSEELFKMIKKDVLWLDIKYGQILLFNQTLPHGNIVNKENETRWSMNCRFKGAFTPYKDKKIGEFFEPITLRTTSQIGMNFKPPKIK